MQKSAKEILSSLPNETISCPNSYIYTQNIRTIIQIVPATKAHGHKANKWANIVKLLDLLDFILGDEQLQVPIIP